VTALLRTALVAAAALVLTGCPRPLPPTLTAASVKAGELPDDSDELLKYADEEMKKDSVVAAENSLVALEKALGRTLTVIGTDYDALWRAARACAWLADEFTDKKTRDQFAYHGVQYADAAKKLQPGKVEGHYYFGINTGLSATTKTISAYNMVPRVRDAAKAAVKLDEKFDHAGPLRLLGSVFAKAPPWPASIGDLEEGLKYLAHAAKIAPDFPQNHLLYGDALAADEKVQEAAREYKLVLDAPSQPEYAHRLERWKKEAAAAIEKLGRNASASYP
jgi:tetratricopeptide (TPR) repeat protein